MARRPLFAKFLLLALVLGVLMPSSASATGFGYDGTGRNWYADNWKHYFFYNDLTLAFLQASNWSRNNNYDPTDIQTYLASSNATADVRIYDAYYGVGSGVEGEYVFYGDALCVKTDVHKCDAWRVRFNLSFTYTTALRRQVVCHEFGHTVGLQHLTVAENDAYWTCMQDSGATSISEHEGAHIDSRYNPPADADKGTGGILLDPVGEVGEI